VETSPQINNIQTKIHYINSYCEYSFAEKMLSMYKIYQPYHVFSFPYLLYDYLFLFVL